MASICASARVLPAFAAAWSTFRRLELSVLGLFAFASAVQLSAAASTPIVASSHCSHRTSSPRHLQCGAPTRFGCHAVRLAIIHDVSRGRQAALDELRALALGGRLHREAAAWT
jgi:hypothetical protein